MLPKFSRRKRTVEDKGTYRQGRLAMQVRQCGFWQIILPYKKRWALREIKAHEPILDDPRRRGTSEEKKKSPTYCSGYTNKKARNTHSSVPSDALVPP